MSARIYTSVVTVGDTSIYQVTGDPNGALNAVRGSLAIDNASPPNIWQNSDGASAWSIAGGSFTMPPNLVQVDPSAPEVAGERYQSIANAQAYVATQAPTANNPWGIQVSGTNNEDIDLDPYVSIIGEVGVTVLTGALRGGPTVAYDEYTVYGCRVENFVVDTAGHLLNFYDCTINDGTSSAPGLITVQQTRISGGDYSGLALLYAGNSQVFGGVFGTFPAVNSIFQDCILQDTTPLTLGGGDFYNSQMWLHNGNATFNDGTYRLRSGSFLRLPAVINFSGSQHLDWHDVVLANTALTLSGTNQCEMVNVAGDSGSILVNGAGVNLVTVGCPDLPVFYSAGSWVNRGDLYDPRASGLASDDTQGAIDELAALNTPQIREYGETVLTIENRTYATTTMINRASTISAGDIWKRLNDCYNHCYFDVTTYASGVLDATHTGLRFTSQAQLVAWIDANIARGGGGEFLRTTRMRCYDYIDPNIEAPARIWATNSIYKRLIDPGLRYYGARTTLRATSINADWSNKGAFLADLWEKVYGVPHPDAGAFDADSYGCFWFSGRKENFYRCGYEATRIAPASPGQNGRRMVTPGNVVSNATDSEFQYDTNGKPTVMALRQDGNSWEFYRFGMSPDEKPYWRQPNRMMAQGWAIALAFGMENAGNRAVLIKPMTIDTFWLPWLDEGDYRYEYVAQYDMQGTPKVRVLPSRAPGYETGNVLGFWHLDDIQDGTYPGVALYGSGEKPGNVHFQVRDLTTGRISPLSNARIRFFGRRRYIQLSAVVETTVAR